MTLWCSSKHIRCLQSKRKISWCQRQIFRHNDCKARMICLREECAVCFPSSLGNYKSTSSLHLPCPSQWLIRVLRSTWSMCKNAISHPRNLSGIFCHLHGFSCTGSSINMDQLMAQDYLISAGLLPSASFQALKNVDAGSNVAAVSIFYFS